MLRWFKPPLLLGGFKAPPRLLGGFKVPLPTFRPCLLGGRGIADIRHRGAPAETPQDFQARQKPCPKGSSQGFQGFSGVFKGKKFSAGIQPLKGAVGRLCSSSRACHGLAERSTAPAYPTEVRGVASGLRV